MEGLKKSVRKDYKEGMEEVKGERKGRSLKNGSFMEAEIGSQKQQQT